MIALVVLLLFGITPPPFASGDPLAQPFCSSSNGNYTPNSTYQANLELLSMELTTNASSSELLFAKGSVGAVPADTVVYGITLCRGDINASTCYACVFTAFQDALELCGLNKDATIYYDACLLSFSDNKDIMLPHYSGLQELLLMWSTSNLSEPLLPGWDPSNPVSTNATTSIITELVDQTAKQAAYNSTRRYATGRMDISTTFPTLFSLAQCVPDMAPMDCSECLGNISQQIKHYFSGKQGGRILSVQCNFRYEIYQFYQGNTTWYIGSPPGIVVPSTPSVPPPSPLVVPPSQKPNSKQHNNISLSFLSIYQNGEFLIHYQYQTIFTNLILTLLTC